jgi:hypothetical protein
VCRRLSAAICATSIPREATRRSPVAQSNDFAVSIAFSSIQVIRCYQHSILLFKCYGVMKRVKEGLSSLDRERCRTPHHIQLIVRRKLHRREHRDIINRCLGTNASKNSRYFD